MDLTAIYPWGRQTILESVAKTGRAMIVHESVVNFGLGAEIAATIKKHSFLNLYAPVSKIAGWATHTQLSHGMFIFPDVASMNSTITNGTLV